MKIRRRLIATIALAAAALTGCGTEDTAKDKAAQAHAEGLSDVYQAQQMQDDRQSLKPCMVRSHHRNQH